MDKDITALPDFQILAKLTNDQRPVIWIKELGAGNKGRMFYTIRGHNKTVYQEPDFRKLILNGVLWATHRMN
jgi:type 1 glutamine amidotransferase